MFPRAQRQFGSNLLSTIARPLIEKLAALLGLAYQNLALVWEAGKEAPAHVTEYGFSYLLRVPGESHEVKTCEMCVLVLAGVYRFFTSQ